MNKVLFVMPSFSGGGAERIILTVAGRLAEDGYQVGIFVMKFYGELIEKIPDNIEVSYGTLSRSPIKISDINNPNILFKLARAMKKYDIVVGGLELYPTYFPFMLNYYFRKRLIGWVHTDLEKYLKIQPKWHTIAAKFMYRKITTIITPSFGTANNLNKLLGLQNNIHTIYNPVSYKEAINNSECHYDSDLMEKTLTLPIIIGVGRLEAPKNFSLLIRAHKKLLDSGTRCNLIILGEGSQRKDLENLVNELGSKNNVFLPGFINNPEHFISKASVFVLSSNFEGFGIVLVEALFLGVPIVSTNCDYGPSEILDDGQLGRLVAVEDLDGMVTAIKSSLMEKREINPVTLLSKISNYDLNNIIVAWEKILEDKNEK